MSKVSIGMPVYNGEAFIHEALDSLLTQTYPDFELIISDNASDDRTGTICKEYAAKDSRVRYVRQSKNLGALGNFKFVLDEAVGEYFMWAAADDVWALNWIEVLLPISEGYSCLAYGTLQSIDEFGAKIYHAANGRNYDYKGSRLIRRVKYYLDPGFLGKANPIYGIFPKSSIIKMKFDGIALHNSDMLFVYDLLAEHEIRATAQTYINKRIHDSCAGGGGVDPSRDKKTSLKKISNLLDASFRGSDLSGYLSLSSPIEKFMLILVYPLFVAKAAFGVVFWKIKRSLI